MCDKEKDEDCDELSLNKEKLRSVMLEGKFGALLGIFLTIIGFVTCSFTQASNYILISLLLIIVGLYILGNSVLNILIFGAFSQFSYNTKEDKEDEEEESSSGIFSWWRPSSSRWVDDDEEEDWDEEEDEDDWDDDDDDDDDWDDD